MASVLLSLINHFSFCQGGLNEGALPGKPCQLLRGVGQYVHCLGNVPGHVEVFQPVQKALLGAEHDNQVDVTLTVPSPAGGRAKQDDLLRVKDREGRENPILDLADLHGLNPFAGRIRPCGKSLRGLRSGPRHP